jgi:hypothetical protein
VLLLVLLVAKPPAPLVLLVSPPPAPLVLLVPTVTPTVLL